MTGWDKAVMEYSETGKAPICPFCKSDRVKVEEYEGEVRDGLFLLCESCKAYAHYDGRIKK